MTYTGGIDVQNFYLEPDSMGQEYICAHGQSAVY